MRDLLQEKKDHLIKKNPNLSDEEKDLIIQFFNKNTSYESKIDWNKNASLTFADFEDIMNLAKDSKSQIKKRSKSEMSLIFKGKDKDFQILDEDEKALYVEVKTYEGAKFADSFECGGQGAKWCIGYEKNSAYWDKYHSKPSIFILALFKEQQVKDTKKVMIEVNYEVSNKPIIVTWVPEDFEVFLETFHLDSEKIISLSQKTDYYKIVSGQEIPKGFVILKDSDEKTIAEVQTFEAMKYGQKFFGNIVTHWDIGKNYENWSSAYARNVLVLVNYKQEHIKELIYINVYTSDFSVEDNNGKKDEKTISFTQRPEILHSLNRSEHWNEFEQIRQKTAKEFDEQIIIINKEIAAGNVVIYDLAHDKTKTSLSAEDFTLNLIEEHLIYEFKNLFVYWMNSPDDYKEFETMREQWPGIALRTHEQPNDSDAFIHKNSFSVRYNTSLDHVTLNNKSAIALINCKVKTVEFILKSMPYYGSDEDSGLIPLTVYATQGTVIENAIVTTKADTIYDSVDPKIYQCSIKGSSSSGFDVAEYDKKIKIIETNFETDPVQENYE